MASSSSSSSCLTPHCKYEVFLSFRGEDTRENFTSHLYAALYRKRIKTFIDENLKRGDEISPALLNAIEGSTISVIIFSKDYASSKWCLDELVKILQCKKMNGQIVIPTFYHVRPSEVRKQNGSFGEAFVEHEKRFKDMPEKVQKWRDALTEASYLSGHESMKIRPEAVLVDAIVKDILKKLEDITISTDSNGLIGINSRIQQVKSLLCIGSPDFRIVGIWGMGGIGKTTLAEAIFKQVSSAFEGRCFMASVREKSQREGGLESLQKQLLSHLLEENIKMGGPNLPQYTKERLRRMRVFIILDDVNKFGQLEYLSGKLGQFGRGSRIIVTTRDRSVLQKYGVENIYEVEKLKNNEALELFCNYAFGQYDRPRDLMEQSKRVIDYSKGNPLALKVLGSFFYQKRKSDWETSLQCLKQISDPDIYDVLKISYNELKEEEQSIFLDIACFFEGEDKDYVIKILDDPAAYHRLKVLADKSLITLVRDLFIQMHDLLQEMGREIVRQESVKEPGKRSRLWYHEDVYQVLKKNKGTDSIEGIFLDMWKIRDLDLGPGAFAKLSNLRLLKFYTSGDFDNLSMSSKVHLPEGLDYLSDELRYLHWHGYPLRTLPMNFSPDNIIELSMPYSKVQQFWDGKKKAFKLKSINLDHSQHLTRIPHSSETPNLESIYLSNCTSLPSIPLCIQNFRNLSILSLSGCRSLRCSPNIIHFSSPITIDFSYCINLTEFPKISGNVVDLDLEVAAIEEIPSSIESLTNLKMLRLTGCKRLKSLSTNICKLKSLRELYLDYCSNLEDFPEILEPMKSLEHLQLNSTKIKKLPSSIEHLEGLTDLWFWENFELDSLPENVGNFKSLRFFFGQKSAITRLPSSIKYLNKLELLRLSGCRGLVLPALSGLSRLRELELYDCDIMEIPQDIGCLSSLETLDLRGNNFGSLPSSIKQLSRLGSLFLYGCNMLQSLPELPYGLQHLDASNCKLLESLPGLSSFVEELDASILDELNEKPFARITCNETTFWRFREEEIPIRFSFFNCSKLNENENSILADSQMRIQHMVIASLKLFHFYEKEFTKPPGFSICLPGNGIPDWFHNQCSGSSINIQLPQHCCNSNFIGFALCVVFKNDEDWSSYEVKCSCRFDIKTLSTTEYFDISNYLDSRGNHVVLGFDPCWDVRLPDGDHHASVSFEFSAFDFGVKIEEKVKCCGVCPVYAHPNYETQPNTFTVNMLPPTEEECIQIRKLYKKFHDEASTSGTTAGTSRSDEEEMEPSPKRICTEKMKAP